MQRLVLALAVAVVLLPGVARSAACSPLDCAPSQFTLGHGTLLGFRSGAAKPVTLDDTGARTRVTIVPHESARTIVLPLARGSWAFDALRGNHLFLIRLLPLGGYEVRLVHLDTGLDAQPLRSRTVMLTARKIADRSAAKKTIAVGYSPDGSTLWQLS